MGKRRASVKKVSLARNVFFYEFKGQQIKFLGVKGGMVYLESGKRYQTERRFLLLLADRSWLLLPLLLLYYRSSTYM